MGVAQRLEGSMQMGPRASERTERRSAFERFTQSRLDRAYRLAGLILRDQSEAEDAVHDAAVQAWMHWQDLRDSERMDAWFDRILVNECRSRLRRQSIRPLVLADPPEPAGPDAFAGLHERDRLRRALAGLGAAPRTAAAAAYAGLHERDRLRRALAGLDADHRIAVVLRYVDDLSPAEIARRTGEREGTVKSRLHYALRQLRATLDAAERIPGGAL